MKKNLDENNRVPVKKTPKNEQYYKFFLESVQKITPQTQNMILSSGGKKGEGIEVQDIGKIITSERIPLKPGYYPLQGGGHLVHSQVPLPDLTPDMISWYMIWCGFDPLRYAIWDPEDHYNMELSAEDKMMLLDKNVPYIERLYNKTVVVTESFDRDTPVKISMKFLNPFEYGFDKKYLGTNNCKYMFLAEAKIIGIIPMYMCEVFKEINGKLENHLYFWFGYKLKNNVPEYAFPKFFKFPKILFQKLMGHNYKEFSHLNHILPPLYAQEGNDWESKETV